MEFVYSANDGLVQNNVNGGTVYLRPGEVWRADDPFVLARPDLFSRVPTVLHSTVDLPQLAPVPLDVKVELAGQDVTSFVRRGPGRPRKLA